MTMTGTGAAVMLVTFTVIFFNISRQGDAAVTMDQLQKAAAMMRTSCMRKTKISDAAADGLRVGSFPDEKPVKCYTYCILEMLQLMKKGKILWVPAVVDAFIPEELQDTFIVAYEKCLQSADGITDKCEAGYEFLKCFHRENPKYFFA